LTQNDSRYVDLAAYALDAVDEHEALSIEALLATDPVAAEWEVALRDAAAEMAAAADPTVEVEAPIDLLAKVIEAAHARRAPVEVEAASWADTHKIEMERFELLLRRLTPEQWQSGVQPKEFTGWTIHDLAAHVASNEALFAQLLGADVDGFDIPETDNTNDARTMVAIERHRGLRPEQTIAELAACVAAVDAKVRAMSDDELEHDLSWWGTDMRVLTVLIARSFETWTHADDIRRAIGLAQLPPPAPSLKAMSSLAAGWTGLMVFASGYDRDGRSVRWHLTGPGGGEYHVDLSLEARDLTGIDPDVEITVDVVDYCRAIGDRFLSGPLAYEATGDIDLARDVVSSLNALATL
jgi:uncharacterized protein (TIGR03083 family)